MQMLHIRLLLSLKCVAACPYVCTSCACVCVYAVLYAYLLLAAPSPVRART